MWLSLTLEHFTCILIEKANFESHTAYLWTHSLLFFFTTWFLRFCLHHVKPLLKDILCMLPQVCSLLFDLLHSWDKHPSTFASSYHQVWGFLLSASSPAEDWDSSTMDCHFHQPLSCFTLHLSPIAWKILQAYQWSCPINTDNWGHWLHCSPSLDLVFSSCVPQIFVLPVSLALGSPVLAEQPCSCCSLGSCKPTASVQYICLGDLSDSSKYLRTESIKFF